MSFFPIEFEIRRKFIRVGYLFFSETKMIATTLLKEPLTPSKRYQFEKLGKGFQFLQKTRWIYIIVMGIFSFKTLLQKTFFGPFYGWIVDSNSDSYSGIPMGLLIFGILAISVPRLIGNINFIVQLKRTAKIMHDDHFKKAYRYQQARIAFYAINIIFIALIANRIIMSLNRYYYSIVEYLAAFAQFPTRYGMDENVIALVVFFGLFSLMEKLVNYLTWREFSFWSQKQIDQDKTSKNSEIIPMMLKGSKWMRYSIILMLFESTIGNIVFNLGLKKLERGFSYFPNQEVMITPMNCLNLSAIYPHQGFIPYHTTENTFQRQNIQKTTINDQHLATTSITSYPIQEMAQYCGFCGVEHRFQNAQYCWNCGREL
ncbi:hypothetical protein NEF87_004919 [Candidatus Lokiarchaeum ossiferum]|uniref:Uncharacterized protein n=1 Tax=Candidatus Lokiarchaeum ossiferum TaxID=2951803 RepID=A0ABY6I1E8_9ARCH|nr:hypothetical protein NEF87_004919 [Candidatus Lokiarchaeum sp. B-35]